MTTEKLDNAINSISSELIAEASIGRENVMANKKNTAKDEPTEVVMGVDIYHRSVWRKVLAAVSVLILIAGIGTGGAFMLKSIKNNNDVLSEQESTSDSQITQNESATPFGDISGGRVRFMTTAYAPYLLDTDPETVKELAEVFDTGEWEQIDSDTLISDGETAIVYVNDNVQPFRLVFYADNTVDYELNNNIVRYRVSENITSMVYSEAKQTNEALVSHLIPCRMEDLTPDGVWKNNEVLPEKIFEVPDELSGKDIIENHPLYEYAFDFQDINKTAVNSDNLIIGKVDGISFEPRGGVAYTQISITVSRDISESLADGERVKVELVGGYISLREATGDTLYKTGGKYGDGISMTEEEIDNTYYHEIVESGELPIIGKEYAFFVHGKGEVSYNNVGLEYGILYKCDNLYIQRNDQGYNFYDLDELKAMLEGRESSQPVVYKDKEMTQAIPHTKVQYEVNENGQTYGTDVESPYIDDLPDLMSVIGDHGKQGYVYRDELLGDPPSSPEEALEQQKSIENGTYTPKVYNVYEADGETIIDTLTESAPN